MFSVLLSSLRQRRWNGRQHLGKSCALELDNCRHQRSEKGVLTQASVLSAQSSLPKGVGVGGGLIMVARPTKRRH